MAQLGEIVKEDSTVDDLIELLEKYRGYKILKGFNEKGVKPFEMMYLIKKESEEEIQLILF